MRCLSSLLIFLLVLAAPAVEAQTSSRELTASSYLDRGNGWLAKGEIERAIADYDLAIATDPRLAEAYYYRGSVRQAK